MPNHRAIPAALAAAALLLAAPAAWAAKFTVTSPGMKAGAMMPESTVFKGFGCSGGNTSPALAWSGAPADTKSFAVTAYDPDAPTGSGWWHWTVVNLPPSTTGLPAGAGSAGGTLPAGAVQGRTDFGAAGYGGPCPPPGKPHHYVFTVWALKTPSLSVDANSSGALVGFMLHANSLAHTSVTFLYGRSK